MNNNQSGLLGYNQGNKVDNNTVEISNTKGEIRNDGYGTTRV